MKQTKDKRITVRLNQREQMELELFKRTFHIQGDGEALKVGMKWAGHYLKNVTELLFPSDYEVILQRKRKTQEVGRKVWE